MLILTKNAAAPLVQTWGESRAHADYYFWGRAPQDVAYGVARWVARGGSLTNYYMWLGCAHPSNDEPQQQQGNSHLPAHRGNNFGRTAGNAITTAYAYDAPVCPDGLPNEPSFSFLGNLHAARHASSPGSPPPLLLARSALRLRRPPPAPR